MRIALPTTSDHIIFSAMLFGSLDGHLSHAVWGKLEQLIRDVVADALADNPNISDQYDFQGN